MEHLSGTVDDILSGPMRWDMPATEDQILEIIAHQKPRRKDLPWWHRPDWWIMDRAYVKALRQGEIMSDARSMSLGALGMYKGIFLGALAMILVFGMTSWAIGIVQSLGLFKGVMVALGYLVLVWMLVFKTYRSPRLRGLIAKLKKKPKEAAS